MIRKFLRDFLHDRLSLGWLASALVLALALVLVRNEGAGTFVLIAAALPAIGLSGALMVRDGRRDREQKAQRKPR